jgi:hypothetical protein
MASGRMGPDHYYYLALLRSHTLVISSSHIYIEIPEFDKSQLTYSEIVETHSSWHPTHDTIIRYQPKHQLDQDQAVAAHL